MDLTRKEIADLAVFFAKRFPSRDERMALAADARMPQGDRTEIDPVTDWTRILLEAREMGTLYKLARTAARTDPGDENLQSVCRLLVRNRERRWGPTLAMAATALLGVGVIAQAFQSPSATPAPERMAGPALVSAVPTAASPAAGSARAAGSSELTDDPNSAEPTPAQAPLAAAVEKEAAPVVPPANEVGRCTLRDGGIVGYWYAGPTAPGASGDVITLGRSVNVRADYPDSHNGYNARSPVRCTLAEGDRMRLTTDPVLVPGDRYWVPLVSGDLLGDDA